ncbi:GNAT family N-acetyltransferase [Phytomonospora endophytica]|uniref:GNAT superfamily N-acetyltransferase n=1 Tax=Phytomonospora endophytica TaxID=714109 RepID=A0A841G0N2_9ACTN|nr:GNAT family N-acetyltransferase [Phytomonospora endophytica]MBB6039488.1 GNAT superfamily N-acetyltransferase [Phytomonospora endophytica]GIG70215.1 N-acetyltransferase [Phytomonospora endophytica]
MILRKATPTDDGAVLALWTTCYPFQVFTEALIRAREVDSPPAEKRLTLLAEVDGVVEGAAICRVDFESADPGVATLALMVAPDSRRRGIGGALHERALAYLRGLGMTRLIVRTGDDDGMAFATARGMTLSRTERISRVDPRDVPAPPALPDGITLRSMADIADLRPVYELDGAVSLDVPGDTPFQSMPYEEWLRAIVGIPIFDAEASMVAYDGDLPVSLACVESAGTRMFSGLAGTLAGYRGRGLARVVKAHALRRAAAKGITEAFTNNDASNTAMLAVNTRLGYREHTRLRVVTGAI